MVTDDTVINTKKTTLAVIITVIFLFILYGVLLFCKVYFQRPLLPQVAQQVCYAIVTKKISNNYFVKNYKFFSTDSRKSSVTLDLVLKDSKTSYSRAHKHKKNRNFRNKVAATAKVVCRFQGNVNQGWLNLQSMLFKDSNHNIYVYDQLFVKVDTQPNY